MPQAGTFIRPEVTLQAIESGVADIAQKLLQRLEQKGRGSYASRHEILGILEEEYDEVLDAIRDDSRIGFDDFEKELLDVAVAGLFGYICLRYGFISKPNEMVFRA